MRVHVILVPREASAATTRNDGEKRVVDSCGRAEQLCGCAVDVGLVQQSVDVGIDRGVSERECRETLAVNPPLLLRPLEAALELGSIPRVFFFLGSPSGGDLWLWSG